MFLEVHASLGLALSVCLSECLSDCHNLNVCSQVLSNSFMSFQVVSSPSESFHVSQNTFKTFQVLSCPSKSFQVLLSLFKSCKFLHWSAGKILSHDVRPPSDSWKFIILEIAWHHIWALRLTRFDIHLNVVEFCNLYINAGNNI